MGKCRLCSFKTFSGFENDDRFFPGDPRGVFDKTFDEDDYRKAAREFEIYLRKVLRRDAGLKLLPADEQLRPPVKNLAALTADAGFWAAIREETGADLIVAAAIDVKVLDRSGYTTEEYVSPQDGQTYFRQVLVEDTGFNYDILLVVVDARRPVRRAQREDQGRAAR